MKISKVRVTRYVSTVINKRKFSKIQWPKNIVPSKLDVQNNRIKAKFQQLKSRSNIFIPDLWPM